MWPFLKKNVGALGFVLKIPRETSLEDRFIAGRALSGIAENAPGQRHI